MLSVDLSCAVEAQNGADCRPLQSVHYGRSKIPIFQLKKAWWLNPFNYIVLHFSSCWVKSFYEKSNHKRGGDRERRDVSVLIVATSFCAA